MTVLQAHRCHILCVFDNGYKTLQGALHNKILHYVEEFCQFNVKVTKHQIIQSKTSIRQATFMNRITKHK